MDNPIQEAQIIEQQSTIDQPTAQDMAKEASTQFLDLQSLIKRYVSSLKKAKDELKIQKDMLEATFLNDETYQLHDKAAKAAALVRAGTRTQILKQPAIAQLDEKVKDLKIQIKEVQENLSINLLEYQKQTGASQIELDDGEVLDIVPSVRLVKRSPDKR
jgi:hypothetical protein